MCSTVHNLLPVSCYSFSDQESFSRFNNMDGKIVMTLLLPKKKLKQARFPYAVQMAIPKRLTPWGATSLISVRLIHKNGSRATALETMDHYDPKEWRAASLAEQRRYSFRFGANPRPWYSILYSLSGSVYRYPGSGNENINNGQEWSEEIESLENRWKTEQQMRNRCEEVLAAEWDRRIAEWGEND
jgi:hypothetical protein